MRAQALIGRGYKAGAIWLHVGFARFGLRRRHVKNIWYGAVPLTEASRVALLVHYHRRGRFLGYFQYLARALEQAGFAVVAISNSPKIDETSLEQTLASCAAVIHRENVGLDFGAWRDGLTLITDPAKLDMLVLANDSIFGPLTDIAAELQKCDFSAADVWGMTDSYDRRYHLQSYFLIFGRAAIGHDSFREFWDRLPDTSHKATIIRYGEVGLTQKLLMAGLRVRALFPYPSMSEALLEQFMLSDDDDPKAHSSLTAYREHLLGCINAGYPLNPTHFFWDYLIKEAGFPFLKRELIEKNPMKIPFIANWRNAIRNKSDFPVELIEEYLQHNSRNQIF